MLDSRHILVCALYPGIITFVTPASDNGRKGYEEKARIVMVDDRRVRDQGTGVDPDAKLEPPDGIYYSGTTTNYRSSLILLAVLQASSSTRLPARSSRFLDSNLPKRDARIGSRVTGGLAGKSMSIVHCQGTRTGTGLGWAHLSNGLGGLQPADLHLEPKQGG
jgi:hypothetical protein